MAEHGSHGTSKDRAKSLLKSKQFHRGQGLRGTGAYFWRKSKYYKQLAKSWHTFQTERGEFSGEFNPSCAILLADIDCKDNEILDLHDADIKEAVGLVVDRYARQSQETKALATAYDKAIQWYEDTNKVKIKLIKVEVGIPSRDHCGYYNVKSLGHPSCLILRDSSAISTLSELSDAEVSSL